MEVDERTWLKAMAASYAMKHLTHRNTGLFPVTLTSDQVVRESFWIGKSIFKLGELPSEETHAVVSILLDGFRSLRVFVSEGEKMEDLKALARRIRENGSAGVIASESLTSFF